MLLVGLILPLLFLGTEVAGHGSMVWPYTWLDAHGVNGLAAGRECASMAMVNEGRYAPSCMWFTNYTFIPGEPTLDPSMKTYFNMYGIYDPYRTNPWRAPGAAPIHSPCGVAGGNPYGCPDGDPAIVDCPGGGYSYGPHAEDWEFEGVQVTEWKRGSVVEAAWGIIANHGGGYSYRLCKVPAEGNSGLTEECFQNTPLKFSGDKQWVQFGNNAETRLEFQANYTTEGTTPSGSMWAKNPIPACDQFDGGYFDTSPVCQHGTQFPPPAPGLEGYGELVAAPGTPTFMFSIGDYLEVPEDLEPGDYVLSFRWDCEQTSQIWATCSSIKITE
eukprot:TRINITY_DN5695_c0_g1_i1.p1 TRINITY_DN5695_c0_g1~~TRINITY_DN5695_c0_g1_i1.p1  ORF type:complete len:329 (-),score=66.56 TRINITY_DN5695_c0_g1_i1:99-1085(-)